MKHKIRKRLSKTIIRRFGAFNFSKYALSLPSFFPYPHPADILINEVSIDTVKRLRSGVKVLIKGYLNKCRDFLHHDDNSFPSEDLKNVVSMFSKCVSTILDSESSNLQEKFNLTDDTLDVFYEVSRELFENEEYDEAERAFFVLTLLKPLNAFYWLGLGMSKQRLEDYDSALRCYAMSGIISVETPLPHMYAAQCFLHLQKRYQARQAIKLALEIVKPDSVEHKQITTFLKKL